MAKDALFDAFASVAQALGNGRRAEIVDELAQGERSVDEVAGEIGQSLANTSHHLRLLANGFRFVADFNRSRSRRVALSSSDMLSRSATP